MEEMFRRKKGIDYPSLFRGIDGFETPADPATFLTDVNNWVPLTVLRELLWQCEKLTGKKDVGYQAGRAYFDPDKKQLPSLFEIVIRVLNDVRSVLIYVDLWASVQTNYLKLQFFERRYDTGSDLHLLSQHEENARPTIGTMHLLRGIAEGFPRLFPSIDEVQCIDEISQLRIEDLVHEFPDFTVSTDGDRVSIHHQTSRQSTVDARKIRLKSEVISLSSEFMGNMPDAVVVSPVDRRINVLTNLEETDSQRKTHAPWAYKIVKGGVVSAGPLSYSFREDQVYNAPYSRFRFFLKERPKQSEETSVGFVRKEVSQLLFEHLEQIKQAHMRMIQYTIEKRRLTVENIHLRREIEREYSFAGIVGKSEQIQDLIGLVRSIAETDVTALVHGETGTGKELIARAIHYNSPRTSKRFVAVNCGSLTETLLESELFGHEKGAFTGAMTQRKGIFEVADGGTLFLDEVSEIPPSTQVKLLRVLQESEFQRVGGTDTIKVNVRLVAATNQNLDELITQGRFRKDLYYRLNVVPVRVPPLRERADDIPLLVSHFIEKRNPQMNKRITGLSPQAMAFIIAYGWPGNVRELENVIQRMMVTTKGEILEVQDLPPGIRGTEEGPQEKAKDLKDIARESAGIAEKSIILGALAKTGGNVTHAARSLGISRATLQNKMKIYGLRARTQ